MFKQAFDRKGSDRKVSDSASRTGAKTANVKAMLLGIAASSLLLGATQVWAHGDVTPQSVDITGLEPLGEEWLDENPYRGNELAIEIGKSAYAQNCARCHGLDAISGGIAPDLRELDAGIEGDEWYAYRVVNGATRNGVPYMPKMADFLSQEALWSIRSWLETVHVE